MLRKAFGWFVVVMGVFVLVQQLPGVFRTNVLFWGGALVVAAGLAVLGARGGVGHVTRVGIARVAVAAARRVADEVSCRLAKTGERD